MGAVAGAVIVAAGVSGLLTWLAGLLALRLFPDFRSREQKTGEYRRDVVSAAAAGSTRQSGVLGPAMLLALTVVLAPACFHWPTAAPRLVYLLILAWLETLIGWLDDWRKSRGLGLGERVRLASHLLVALVAAALYVRLGFAGHVGVWGQAAQAIAAAVALLYVVLSTGFSDGVDGLTASFTTMTTLALVVLGILWAAPALGVGAGAALGAAAAALVLNMPSNWTRTNGVPRRSRAYLGDSGALLCGTLVAGLAITSGTIVLLPLVATGVVLEGASVFLQTGILTPLFRRRLTLRRFRAMATFVPHTEFPLPFLATPVHHHLNLLGLTPLQIGSFFWTLQGVTSLLGLGAALVIQPWWRAGLWTGGVLLALLPVAALVATKPLFLSVAGEGAPDLLLCRGLPLSLAGCRLYRIVEQLPGVRAPAGNAALLDRPMHRYDALALAALAAAAGGHDEAAARLVRRIPPLNLLLRPEAALLVVRLAEGEGTLPATVESWQRALRPLYQEGRVDLVLGYLADVADERGEPALAAAIRYHLRSRSAVEPIPAPTAGWRA